MDYLPIQVRDLDGDGNWEFTVLGWEYCRFFRYLRCHRSPHVILHYEDGAFRIAADLMRKPAPTKEEMEETAKEIRQEQPAIDKPSDTPRSLWDYTLILIYTGHAELVEPFLELVWPDDPTSREIFLEQLRDLPWDTLGRGEVKELSAEWPWSE
jgi:hypothetical protein